MDIEPDYKMLTCSASDQHIITHNMIGAALIAPITFGVLRGGEGFRPIRYTQTPMPKAVLAGSCIFGAFSNVFLDGMYHVNMGLPQAQWALAQASLASLSGTETLCVSFLMAGAVIHSLRMLLSCVPIRLSKFTKINSASHVYAS